MVASRIEINNTEKYTGHHNTHSGLVILLNVIVTNKRLTACGNDISFAMKCSVV